MVNVRGCTAWYYPMGSRKGQESVRVRPSLWSLEEDAHELLIVELDPAVIVSVGCPERVAEFLYGNTGPVGEAVRLL
jgi:hypothetical protein